jgi:hypothetical protein
MVDKKKSSNGKDKGDKPTKPAVPAPMGVALSANIEWHIPEGLASIYANQAAMQIGPTETFINFFEIHAPIFAGTPEQVREQASKLKTVKATCVARIVIAHEFFPIFAKSVADVLAARMKQPAGGPEPEE